MSRAREMIERNLGTDTLTACLFNGMTEITVPGYRSVPLRNWEIDDDEAIVAVRFGPFQESVTFNRYAIYEGDKPMIRHPRIFNSSIPARVLVGLATFGRRAVRTPDALRAPLKHRARPGATTLRLT